MSPSEAGSGNKKSIYSIQENACIYLKKIIHQMNTHTNIQSQLHSHTEHSFFHKWGKVRHAVKHGRVRRLKKLRRKQSLSQGWAGWEKEFLAYHLEREEGCTAEKFHHHNYHMFKCKLIFPQRKIFLKDRIK